MGGTVHIVVRDVYSTVENAPRAAWALIRKVCRARPENYMYMPRYKAKMWDGYISLMKGMKSFPTGLLSMVKAELQDKQWKVITDYQIVRPVRSGGELHGVELRDYQREAVDSLLLKNRGIARMATNAGKTFVFAAIIKELGNRDALVVVHSLDLLYQIHRVLEETLDRRVGIIGDSRWNEIDVSVATVQTLFSKRKSSVDLGYTFMHNRILVVDESHHVGNNTVFDVLMDVPGWHRYGFSGTPLNRGVLNDLKLIACTGPVVVDVPNSRLIEEEWSAKPIIIVHDVPETGSVADWESDYPTTYVEQIVENTDRNQMIVDTAKEELARGPVLIIVSRIDHGVLLLKMLEGSPAVMVYGDTDVSERTRVLSEVGSGKRYIVIATQIFDEGVDIPALGSVILACGGKSQTKLLQRIGRGLRRKDGDNVVHIHDFLDGNNEYILNHTEERVRVYRSEGFEIEYESGE